MKKVVVTGGAGFIGSHLVDALVYKEDCIVRVVDNFSSGRIENIGHHLSNPSVNIIRGDLKNLQVVDEAIRDFDVVFHFAANPEVRVSSTYPEVHFNENLITTFNLLEAMRKRDVNIIVFASSSSVYGEPKHIPVREESPLKPVSVYGATKAACEMLIHAYVKLYGLKAIVLRYANVVGPRLRHGVVYDFVVKLLRNPVELEILGDGSQTRSYMYIDDAIEATLQAWKGMSGKFVVYNVASEDFISVKEVADLIVRTMKLNNVKYVFKSVLHGVGWPGDVKRIALDISKLKRFGWKPKMSSAEAVIETAKALLRELRR